MKNCVKSFLLAAFALLALCGLCSCGEKTSYWVEINDKDLTDKFGIAGGCLSMTSLANGRSKMLRIKSALIVQDAFYLPLDADEKKAFLEKNSSAMKENAPEVPFDENLEIWRFNGNSPNDSYEWNKRSASIFYQSHNVLYRIGLSKGGGVLFPNVRYRKCTKQEGYVIKEAVKIASKEWQAFEEKDIKKINSAIVDLKRLTKTKRRNIDNKTVYDLLSYAEYGEQEKKHHAELEKLDLDAELHGGREKLIGENKLFWDAAKEILEIN